MNGTATNIPVAESFTTQVPPGDIEVTWTASDANGNETLVVQEVTVGSGILASGSVDLSDRVTIVDEGGDYALIANSGTGQTSLGVESIVGGIESVGPVFLRDRSTVRGDVISSSTITQQNSVTVDGALQANTSVLLPPSPAIPSFTSGGAGIMLEPGQSATAFPGSYSNLVVKTNSTLTIKAGTINVDQLQIEPGATVILEGDVNLVVGSSMIYREAFSLAPGATLELWYLGSSSVVLEADFDGRIFAPDGMVTLGGSQPIAFRGGFFGKNLLVRPDVQVVCTL